MKRLVSKYRELREEEVKVGDLVRWYYNGRAYKASKVIDIKTTSLRKEATLEWADGMRRKCKYSQLVKVEELSTLKKISRFLWLRKLFLKFFKNK